MPKRIAVTVVKIKNFSTGICEICAHKLTTRAVEQPMISRPPMISPQRMLLSSMNEVSTSEKDRRGVRGGGAATSTGTGAEVGSITILSSVAKSEAVTTAGSGVGVDRLSGTGGDSGGATPSRSARIRFINAS